MLPSHMKTTGAISALNWTLNSLSASLAILSALFVSRRRRATHHPLRFARPGQDLMHPELFDAIFELDQL